MLQHLSLTNFRGFAELELSFEPDLTLILGVNGVGKSSIVRAIVLGQHGTQRVSADVRVGATKSTNDARWSPEKVRLPIIAFRAARDSDLVSGRTAVGLRRKSKGYGYPEIKDESWADAASDPDKFYTWFHELEDLENEALRDDPNASDRRLDRLRSAISSCLPGIDSLRIRRRVGGESKLFVRKEGLEIPLEALSDGERAMLVMVGEITRRTFDFNGSATQPFVLLIDEIEAHLHPQWQHRVLPDLQRVFPNAQIIATTHSPIVAGSVPSRCLRVLRDFALVPVDHTEGRHANDLLEEVFGVPSRRQEVQDRLDALGDLIDDGAFGTAETELGELTAMLGPNDTELAYYRGLLHGRKASA